MTSLDIIRLNRNVGIGSTDAKRIVEGDWHTLYNEKVGLSEPIDLSGVFKVQLGIHTEGFHLDWLERMHAITISRPDQRYYHATRAYMYCHLDGWHDQADTFVEVKHSDGNATVRDRALYYMPQLQHALAVTGKSQCFFSVIAGNDEPEWCVVDRNPEYVERLLDMEQSFWWHVENRVPPEITPTGTQAEIQRIGATTPIDGLKPYDMAGNNHWALLAHDYLANREAAALFESSKSQLKELVPADAIEATGHGVTIKRDKRGSLRFGS